MNQIVKSAVFCFCALLACVLTSCEEIIYMQQGYKFGISTMYTEGMDFLLIYNYLESKGVKNDDIIITEGKSVAECDVKAKKLFDEKVALLSHDEIKAIVNPSCSFTYSATRYEQDGETLVTIGSWSYPAE